MSLALIRTLKVTEDFVLINSGPLGTTYARVGCMPSKIMIQIGDDYHRRQVLGDEGIDRADRLGIDIAQYILHRPEINHRPYCVFILMTRMVLTPWKKTSFQTGRHQYRPPKRW